MLAAGFSGRALLRRIAALEDMEHLVQSKRRRSATAPGMTLWPAREIGICLPSASTKRLLARSSFEWASACGNGTLDVEAEPIRDGVEGITGAVVVAREPTGARPVRETTAGRA